MVDLKNINESYQELAQIIYKKNCFPAPYTINYHSSCMGSDLC